jgi:hypothetical protein
MSLHLNQQCQRAQKARQHVPPHLSGGYPLSSLLRKREENRNRSSPRQEGIYVRLIFPSTPVCNFISIFFNTAHSLHCLESTLTPLGGLEDAPSATRFRRICALYIVAELFKGTSIMETRQAGWWQWRRPTCVPWRHMAAMIAQGTHNDERHNIALKDEKRMKHSLACTACAANRFCECG